MRIKLLLLFAITLLPNILFSQTGTLTILSEDGDKFTLYLDDAQQNTNPQTNLRVDGLTQTGYKARIVFEDKTKEQIEKSITVTQPGTNTLADVVYKINNKGGVMKLRYFSSQQVQSGYIPPAGTYIVHYGQPDPGVTVTHLINTPGGNIGNGSIGITPIGGSSNNTDVNMSFSAPPPANNSRPAGITCASPMEWGAFKAAKETVKSSAFEDAKLSSAKSILTANCLSAEQVLQLCQLFGFEQTKLTFAKLAYTKTTDPANYFKVANAFTFNSNKQALNDFISNGGR